MATYRQLHESLNLSESEASDKAKKAGLVSRGGGAYAKEKGGPTVAKSVDGKLVSVGGGDKEKEPKEELPSAADDCADVTSKL